MARAAVGRVIDGRTFILDDGRTVRLAGIEVPHLPAANAAQSEAGGAAAKAGLAALVSAVKLELRRADVASDRYGRIVAYADVLREGSRRSAQAELISAGLARVGADIQNQACARELLRRESTARRAKLGLWADRYYQPLRADDSPDILARRGHFALIEGKVISVHESGATVYVNFGRRWSQDFAVTIRKRNEDNFAAAGLDLNALADRRVLVRGWIQARGGGASGVGYAFWRAPWIEAESPEQIDLAGHD
jgi:endonuclease YncB( thermonuclease family)